jgi:S-adenosylmethionine:tRNA ribosyltransferase-isomerase
VQVSLFDYNLPQELIAQFPARKRDQSRLMVVDRSTGQTSDHKFSEITTFLSPGDALIVNNTKVFKARLIGSRKTGGKVEIFLVRPESEGSERWIALVMPGRRVNEGEEIVFGKTGTVILDQRCDDGSWRVSFTSRTAREKIIASAGHVPLPPYVSRDDQPSDIRRYQTVYAAPDKVGAVAAPTAGFHFTRPMLETIRESGIEIIELTLHVGPGTFRPIKTDSIDEHFVDPEYAELPPESAARINTVRAAGGRLFVVGTTCTRTLEAAPVDNDRIQTFSGPVDLYIQPGHDFRWVDHLITNFHLPKSSLLVLVAAFTGRERILSAYAEAVQKRYRFYSYGDAMLIL